jgi:hypothetical protein
VVSAWSCLIGLPHVAAAQARWTTLNGAHCFCTARCACSPVVGIGAAHHVEIDRETTMSAPTPCVCVPTREKLAAPTTFEWEKTP